MIWLHPTCFWDPSNPYQIQFQFLRNPLKPPFKSPLNTVFSSKSFCNRDVSAICQLPSPTFVGCQLPLARSPVARLPHDPTSCMSPMLTPSWAGNMKECPTRESAGGSLGNPRGGPSRIPPGYPIGYPQDTSRILPIPSVKTVATLW